MAPFAPEWWRLITGIITYGFILHDSAVKGLKTWKNLYLHMLNIHKAKNPVKFALLPKEEKFISNRGNPLFSITGNELRVAEKLSEGFFVAVNLSANMIRNNLRELLGHFDIEPLSMKIYLREDRDAESNFARSKVDFNCQFNRSMKITLFHE